MAPVQFSMWFSMVAANHNMTRPTRTILQTAVLTLALLTGVVADGMSQPAPVDREQLTVYARTHLALDAARDEFHARIARIHDDVGLARARAELDATVARIFVEHAISSERYGEITLLISQNEAVRAVFDEISRQLREASPAPS